MKAEAKLNWYRAVIDRMQDNTFYVEDGDGVLRRWYPPTRPIFDKKEDV